MTRRRRLLQPILEEVYAQFRVLQKIIGTRLNHPQNNEKSAWCIFLPPRELIRNDKRQNPQIIIVEKTLLI